MLDAMSEGDGQEVERNFSKGRLRLRCPIVSSDSLAEGVPKTEPLPLPLLYNARVLRFMDRSSDGVGWALG